MQKMLCVLLLLSSTFSLSGQDFDILILNGKVIDGTGNPWRLADIGVKDGKIGDPIKGATLIGDGPETMGRITGIGNDMALDEGIGMCGKAGQGVPVGVGQPHLRMDAMTVGGTEH